MKRHSAIVPKRHASLVPGLVGTMLDAIKINATWSEERKGRTVWLKRRRPASVPLIPFANRFFRLAQNRVQLWRLRAEWQHWEVHCYQMLNGDDFGAWVEDERTVAADEVPGISLCCLLQREQLTHTMLRSAGRELARVHSLYSGPYGAEFSHSDPHLGNVIYDAETDRARLIDFETFHDPALQPAERHADDLLVFLLDLSSRFPISELSRATATFLGAYGRREALACLDGKLKLPEGFARLWWTIRMNYIGRAEVARRLDCVLRGLRSLSLPPAGVDPALLRTPRPALGNKLVPS